MIPVTNSDEFAKLLRGLADDVVSAHFHWRLHCDLVDTIKKQSVVWAQSRTFWDLTVAAHELTALGYLCKAFDQRPKSLHLRSLLSTVRENLRLFDAAEFKQRLAKNPHVESLAKEVRVPDRQTLSADIRECSSSDPLVRRLVAHRGSALAHRGVKRTLKPSGPSGSGLLSVADVEALLSRARAVLNRYSNLFAAETNSVNMIGRDDYAFIFSSVAAAVEYQDVSQMFMVRSGAGLTQDAVAERMGTTKSAISRLESAVKHAPSLATLKRYASAVGCELQVKLVRQ